MNRAPGKLFLLGEYAVLHGGLALVAAVDRYVEAVVRNDRDGYKIIGATLDARLPVRVLDVAERAELLDKLTVDVSAVFEGEEKLGFGSSAASCVAILRAARPDLADGAVFAIADHAHRLHQNGRGSGADVAAATFGGLLAYRIAAEWAEYPWIGEPPRFAVAEPVELPFDIRIEAFWLGQPASSSELSGQVAKQVHRPDVRATLSSIAATASLGIDACVAGQAADFLAALDSGDALMERLGEQTAAPIVIDGHKTLRTLAKEFGFVAKPSGAGGGDFSIVAGSKSGRWLRFTTEAAAAGLVHYPVDIAAPR